MSVRRHTVYNVAGAVVPLTVTLVTLPLYVDAVGDARYGVLAILWTLFGYLGLFDFGLGPAVTNRIASLSQASSEDRGEVFWTALLLSLGFGAAGAIVLWAAGIVVFGHFVPVPGPLSVEVVEALPLMAAAFPLVLSAGVLSGALVGQEDFFTTNVVRIGEGTLVQAVPLAVALAIGPELPYLVGAVLIVRALGSLALYAVCRRRFTVHSSPTLRWAIARTLLSYGGWMSVSGTINTLLSSLDRFLIGSLVGVRAVTYYAVPYSLAFHFHIIPFAVANALFPKFSSPNQYGAQMQILAKSVVAMGTILTPLFILAVLGVELFINVWMGVEFSERSSAVAELLLIGVAMNGIAYIPMRYLQGVGRPSFIARLYMLETLPYLLGLWFGLREFGIIGASAVWVVRAAVDSVVLIWASSGLRAVRALGVPVVLLTLTSLLVLAFSPLDPIRLSLGGILVAIACMWALRQAPQSIKSYLMQSRR